MIATIFILWRGWYKMKNKNHFETREEALTYKEKHQLYVRIPKYLPCVKKWALVFSLKTFLQVEE